MAQAPTADMAFASFAPVPTRSLNIPKLRHVRDHSGTANFEKRASALLTPPTSVSPDMSAQVVGDGVLSPPPINITQDMDIPDAGLDTADMSGPFKAGMPLNSGALSNLDASAAITPNMLAKYHLPGIMLGNGPKPIRYVMGELTHSVPGFSRIPPAKARRIVVAALENRAGGGPDGNVAFCKTGWGRWDAHYKGSSRDSGIGSFHDGNMSPPRSERSSYALSYSDSAVHMAAPHLHARYRDHHSGGSRTASSIREEDEFDMDMDPIEEAADQMSLDGDSDDSSLNEETDDEDWAAVGVEALRKASLPAPNAPIHSYRAVSTPYTGRWATKNSAHRPSNTSLQHPASVPSNGHHPGMHSAAQTPEEKAAIAALLSLGSM